MIGVNTFFDDDDAVDILPNEFLEEVDVEGARDKSEKTGGVRGNPVLDSSLLIICDGGANDSNCLDSSSGDIDVLLILLILLILIYYVYYGLYV